MSKKVFKAIVNAPSFLAIFAINAYQHLLSPDHSWLKAKYPYGFCRHYPTCSEYTKQSIAKFGLIKGTFLGTKRVSKCHPWAEPSVDLVP